MSFKTWLFCFLALGRIVSAEDPLALEVFQKLYKPILQLPNLSMEWTDQSGGVVINRREFLYESGRFVHKTYHATNNGERLLTTFSYDGEFYYYLFKDVLTVSTSLKPEDLRIAFRAAFVYTPIFLPLSFSMSKYPANFTPPQLMDQKVWMLGWTKKMTPITPSLFEGTDGEEVYRFQFSDDRLKYGERIKGEFLCRWTIDDWFTISNQNEKYQMPTSITLSFPEGHTYFYDCFRMNKAKCKLLSEPVPRNVFRIPASSARKTHTYLDAPIQKH